MSTVAEDNCLVGLNCGIRDVLALNVMLKARHPASHVNKDASAIKWRISQVSMPQGGHQLQVGVWWENGFTMSQAREVVY